MNRDYSISTALLLLLLSGCASKPVTKMDNYDLCRELANNLPRETAKRVLGAIGTLGFSELVEAKNAEEVNEIRAEMDRRNLPACDSKTQAKSECGKIYNEQSSPEFQTCVLTIANSIEARISSDIAAAEARNARAAAYRDSQE